MGVGMFVQQKMMTATTDPTQAKMMYLMPVLFTFMFWNSVRPCYLLAYQQHFDHGRTIRHIEKQETQTAEVK